MGRSAKQSFGGDWTETKLAALREYLVRYTAALSSQPFILEYIDAFAGTGYREQREYQHEDGTSLFKTSGDDGTDEYFDGSARIALQIPRPFDRYTFVELSAEKAEELKSLKHQFPKLSDRISIETKDANSYLVARATENWRAKGARAVVFVDPFGMQVEWETIASLAKTEAIDLWLLFPVNAINRLLSKEGVRYRSWKERLDKVFGGEDWMSVFYRKVTDSSFFEPAAERLTKAIDIDGLTKYMVAKLKTVFAGVVDKPLILSGKTGVPLFAFCFAASNKVGAPIAVRIAKHIVGK